MRLTRRQLRNIINESITGRIKQALGLGDVFENCFSIGITELKNKLGSYVQNKVNTVGFNRAMTTIDRRGDRGDFLIPSINDLVDSVDMTFNKSFIDNGERYQIVYTQLPSLDISNAGGTFGQTLLNLTIEIKEIDENNSSVKAVFHGGDRFSIGGYRTSSSATGGYVGSGAPSVNMDTILSGGLTLLKRKFIEEDMSLRQAMATNLASGESDFSRDDLFSNQSNLGFAGIVTNGRISEFCTALSRLANEFVQAKIEFTVDMTLTSVVHAGATRDRATDQVELIDLKIYQAQENMRAYLS